jgi:hypothetical protein
MIGSIHRQSYSGMWAQGSWWRDAKLAPGSLLLPPLQTRELDVEGFDLRSYKRSLAFRASSHFEV